MAVWELWGGDEGENGREIERVSDRGSQAESMYVWC